MSSPPPRDWRDVDSLPGVTRQVERWLGTHLGLVLPLAWQPFPAGRSNLTYLVRDAAGLRCVLRRPPLVSRDASAHDVSREYRMLGALTATDVPVPTPLGLCRDAAVAGAPFFVMDYVEGPVVADEAAAATAIPLADRKALAAELVRVLGMLHGLDADALGFPPSGRAETYLTRQVQLFRSQIPQLGDRTSGAREVLERLSSIGDQLVSRVPERSPAAIVHGDYRLGNLVLRGGDRVRAVLDWELSTVGDPLADLAWLLVYWAGPDGSPLPGLSMPTCAPGFPGPEEVLADYAQVTGRPVGAIGIYRAFAAWKLAVILMGVRERDAAGGYGPDGRDPIPLDTIAALLSGAQQSLRGRRVD